MPRILLVQRSLTHYRRLLLNRLTEVGDFQFDVYDLGDRPSPLAAGELRCFPSKRLSFGHGGKSYSLVYSRDLVSEVAKVYPSYDAVILEGATNLPISRAISRSLKGKKPYVVWDAGRRRGAAMTPLRKLAQRPLMDLWNGAASIMAYSTCARDYFVDQRIDPSKVFVCQNTLSVHDFDVEIARLAPSETEEIHRRFAPDGPMVLYVGAVEQRKRIDDLVAAFSAVRESIPGASLVIVGGGGDLDRLRGSVADLGLSGIHFTGPIIEGVIAYFMACDLFVLPSEGGLSINQAMICGKPVVASSADGTELDLIEDGVNGRLFEERNVAELAEVMSDLLKDGERLRGMGERTRERIEKVANEELFAKSLADCLEFAYGKE